MSRDEMLGRVSDISETKETSCHTVTKYFIRVVLMMPDRYSYIDSYIS